MKRWIGLPAAAALALCLSAGCAGAEPSDAFESFWWDVNDTEIVSQSSGTGGSSADAPVERGRKGLSLWMQADVDALGEEMPAFADWWAAFGEDIKHYDVEAFILDGRLLMVTLPGYLAEDGQMFRAATAAFELRTGERLRLSDLFYDGVNYIATINDQAALALFGVQEGLHWQDDYPREADLSASALRRPFSGFPADYPHFTIAFGPEGGRMLGLVVEMENPLFTLEPTDDPAVLWVPLTAEGSPYGLRWVQVDYQYSEALYDPAEGAIAWEQVPVPTEAPWMTYVDEDGEYQLMEWGDPDWDQAAWEEAQRLDAEDEENWGWDEDGDGEEGWGEYAEDMLFQGLGQPGVYTARVRLGATGDPAAEARINEALATLARSADGHPMRDIGTAYPPLYPQIRYGERMLSAVYRALDAWDRPIFSIATLGGLCVDMDTGELLDGEALFEAYRDHPEATLSAREFGDDYMYGEVDLADPNYGGTGEEVPYDPPKGALPLGVWVEDWENMLCTGYLDPYGFDVVLAIPIGLLQADGVLPEEW